MTSHSWSGQNQALRLPVQRLHLQGTWARKTREAPCSAGGGLRALPWALPPQTMALSFRTCARCPLMHSLLPCAARGLCGLLLSSGPVCLSVFPASRPLCSPAPQSRRCSNFHLSRAGCQSWSGGGGQRETVWEGTDAPSNGVTSSPGEGRGGSSLPAGSFWQWLKVRVPASWLLPHALPPSQQPGRGHFALGIWPEGLSPAGS